ncbi:MAG: DMT family transporter [Bacteroidota bacterium]
MTKQHRAEFFLFLTTFIWGSTFVITKGSLEHISQLFFIAIRFTSAAIILTILFFQRVRKLSLKAFLNGMVLGILLFTGFVTQNVGIIITTASKSAFFTGTMVVFVPMVQFIVDKRLPRLGNLIGVVLAALGLYLLTSPTGSEFNKGDGLTIICAIAFAIYIVYLDKVSAFTDTFELMYSQMLVMAVCSIIGMLTYEKVWIDFSPGLGFSLAYLTIFATLLTTWVQTRYQGDTMPTRAAIIFTTEPVIAATLAYFVRGEMIGIAGVIGGIIIVGGLLISELSDSIPWLNGSFSPSSE